jgi:hypothetical protein
MNDPIIRLLFLAHLGSSVYMLGLIWFVQIVHYPLFANVGSQEFPSYEQRRTARTTWVVAPAMLIEGATAVLLIWFRPTSVAEWSVWTGLALLGVSWLREGAIDLTGMLHRHGNAVSVARRCTNVVRTCNVEPEETAKDSRRIAVSPLPV